MALGKSSCAFPCAPLWDHGSLPSTSPVVCFSPKPGVHTSYILRCNLFSPLVVEFVLSAIKPISGVFRMIFNRYLFVFRGWSLPRVLLGHFPLPLLLLLSLLFYMCCPCVSAQFVERLYFFHCIAFVLLWKISWLYLCGFISVLSIFSLSLSFYFFTNTHCLDYRSFILNFEIM